MESATSRHRTVSPALVAAACAMLLLASGAIRVAAGGPADPGDPGDPGKMVYKPPQGTEGGARVDGVARDRPRRIGETEDPPSLFVLSPEHVGLTVQEAPTVFWFMSKPVAAGGPKLRLRVTQNGVPKPLLNVQLEAGPAGVRRLDLGKQKEKLALAVGVEYKWSVALEVDPQQRSADVISSGMIKRVEPSVPLLNQLKALPGQFERTLAFAEEGIWYDALALLSSQIDAGGANAPTLLERRAGLLELVDLKDAAAFDRQAARKGRGDPARGQKAPAAAGAGGDPAKFAVAKRSDARPQ